MMDYSVYLDVRNMLIGMMMKVLDVLDSVVIYRIELDSVNTGFPVMHDYTLLNLISAVMLLTLIIDFLVVFLVPADVRLPNAYRMHKNAKNKKAKDAKKKS